MSNDIFRNSLTQIEAHPVTGTAFTIINVLFAAAIKILDNGHIHPLVMDIFQLLAWLVAIIVGTVTIFGYIKRWFLSRESKKY